ncbi:MAG: branched-chain amino acid ABC transporter permease [bacterium]|nr:branched-chain amino acid ABC transporter permease [bacterium]
MNTTDAVSATPASVTRRHDSSGEGKVVGAFLIVLAALFWVPDLILYMEWAVYWNLFLIDVFIWSLFAVAFNLLMGYTGMISFGQAAYLGIGGYTAGLLLKKISGLPFALGLISGPIGGALAALIIGYFCIRRTHIYFAILTLAFGHIIYLICFKWYDFTGGDNGLIGIPVPDWILESTFSNYYKFVLVICLASVYLLWRIVNSPFGKTLSAIRENPERADFVGVNVKLYQLYAFMVAGFFSGLAGTLIMINERSIYPDLAHWTQSTQVLLMSLLGGVYTFFGPMIGALILLTMDADITQDYPEIWQLFLGSTMVLILYGLPGGILGFITISDVASGGDDDVRIRKILDEFTRKFWYFFIGALFFTGFFSILLTPHSWLISDEWDFVFYDPMSWGIVPRTIVQAIVGAIIVKVLLRGLKAFLPLHRWLLLIFPLAPLVLHVYLVTPLSGLLVIVLWGLFTYYNLLQKDVKLAFHPSRRDALSTASGSQ